MAFILDYGRIVQGLVLLFGLYVCCPLFLLSMFAAMIWDLWWRKRDSDLDDISG